MKAWYVVRTHASAENRATQHLENQNFEVYCPRIRKRWRHARRSQLVARPLFPRYLFVRLDVELDAWRCIKSTLGVDQIISQGERPLPVPDTVIDEIRAREDTEGLVTLEPTRLKKGAPLRILEGAFSDFVGVFEEMTDDRRVIMLLELLGRQVRIKTQLRSVAAEI